MVSLPSTYPLSGRSPADDPADPGCRCTDRRCASWTPTSHAVRSGPGEETHSPVLADLTEIAAEAMGTVDHRFVAALTGTPAELVGRHR